MGPTVGYSEAIVRSGKELGPEFGTLVGESSLRRANLLLLSRSTMTFPRVDAWSSTVWEYQAGSTACIEDSHDESVITM